MYDWQIFTCLDSVLPLKSFCFSLCVCFAQDAVGEELRRAVVFFPDGVWAGGNTTIQSVQESDSSDCHLQNWGEAYTGEVDPPCFAGNTSQAFDDPGSGPVKVQSLWKTHENVSMYGFGSKESLLHFMQTKRKTHDEPGDKIWHTQYQNVRMIMTLFFFYYRKGKQQKKSPHIHR